MEDRADILRDMKVCRFCLSGDGLLTNIYEKTSKDKQFVPLPLQIMACVAIEVFANDGMPQLICKTCRDNTIQSYTFKTNCKKSDDALKLFLATGELTKPYLKPFPNRGIQKSPSTSASKPRPSTSASSEPKPKKIKVENSEIITLNFGHDSDVREGENEDECILGMENSSENDDAATGDEDQEYSEQDDHKLTRTLRSNQVKTDCFPCPHCDRSFPLQQLLDLHVVNHDRERSFECEECGRKFFTKYDLGKHAHTHSGKKPFSCIVCKRAFSRESLLQRHERIHNDVPKYLCTQCDKTFLTSPSLDQHMEKHKKKRPYTCSTCDKSFVFKQGLERHEFVHSNDKPHKCNYCEASFASAIKLTRHITSHAGLRPYPCKICGRSFLLSHHLTRHMRSHYATQNTTNADNIVGPHKCDICSMSFRRKDSLINHSAIHSMVNLRCVICNTKFDNAKMVKGHITTHLSGLPFPCEKCDYSFESQDQLEEHEVKHAEMEYEEQIEKEVEMEAKSAPYEEPDASYDDEEDGEVAEFTLTNDINNPEVVRRSKRSSKVESYSEFLKDELGSDLEEQPEEAQQEEQEEDDIEPIKPIVRSEGTKVYGRKSFERKIPSVPISNIKVAPLDQITQPETTSIEELGLDAETLNAMPNKRFVNMKFGDKTIRVQKYIVTKEEMKRMAKQGILEMKGGSAVVLRSPGQPVMNATLKSMDSMDIESLMQDGRVKLLKPQLKTFPKREADVNLSNTEYSSEEMGSSSTMELQATLE